MCITFVKVGCQSVIRLIKSFRVNYKFSNDENHTAVYLQIL